MHAAPVHVRCAAAPVTCAPAVVHVVQWELDLHGLHVREALSALQQRLELLDAVIADGMLGQQGQLGQQPAAASGPGRPGQQAQALGARQRVLAQLLLTEPGDIAWQQQQAAARQELRVIVGRGTHSANGEASLPAAVCAFLDEAGWRYVRRAGALDVKLRRLAT